MSFLGFSYSNRSLFPLVRGLETLRSGLVETGCLLLFDLIVFSFALAFPPSIFIVFKHRRVRATTTTTIYRTSCMFRLSQISESREMD